MRAILKIFNRLEEYSMIVIFPILVILVFVATLVRYLNLGSMPWADEGSRYLMICLVFVSISYCFRHDTHLGMSFLVDGLPKSLKPMFKWIRVALILLFGGQMIYATVLIIQNQMGFSQKSAALGIPMYCLYAVMLVGWIFMVIRTIQAALYIPADNPEEKEEVPSI